MNKVNPIKLNKVAIGLLNNKSYTEALLDAGYTQETAERGKSNKVVEEALNQNKSAMNRSGMSKERCIKELLWGLKQSRKLEKKKDCLQMHAVYMSIIARHYLPEKFEADNPLLPPTYIINTIKTTKENRLPVDNSVDKSGVLGESVV